MNLLETLVEALEPIECDLSVAMADVAAEESAEMWDRRAEGVMEYVGETVLPAIRTALAEAKRWEAVEGYTSWDDAESGWTLLAFEADDDIPGFRGPRPALLLIQKEASHD